MAIRPSIWATPKYVCTCASSWCVRARVGHNLQAPQIQKLLGLFFFPFSPGKTPDLLIRTQWTLFYFFLPLVRKPQFNHCTPKGLSWPVACLLITADPSIVTLSGLTLATMFVGWPVSFLGPLYFMKLGRPSRGEEETKKVWGLFCKRTLFWLVSLQR